jgi:transcriptional regulator GlxA family with amidase domain
VVVEPRALVIEIVRADDGGVAPGVAAAEPALVDHRDVGDPVLLGEIVGGAEPVAAGADDDDVVFGLVDVLRLAADEADRSRQILCEWTVLSADMESIQSSCGVKVQPDTRLRLAGDYDYVVVVGGLIGEHSILPPDAIQFLCKRAEAGTPLIGLCTGVFILQEAGLLNGYRCCVSWFHYQDFLDRFDSNMLVADRLFVTDRDRITCPGGYGATHLAAFLVERHVGYAAATKSLNILMIADALGGEEPQPGQHITQSAKDPFVKKAILRMQQSIEMPKTIDELATEIKVGRRSLERRFQNDLNMSPSKAYLDLRLERAIMRLRTTDETITRIALSAGFCDASHLARVLKSERGLRPSDYREGRTAKPL